VRPTVLECVVNISEGRDSDLVAMIARAGGDVVLDVHSDPDHHRSVLTMAGDDLEPAVRAVAHETVRRLDLGTHAGVHPRFGVLDVVPFVPLDGSTMTEAVDARDRFISWAERYLMVPCLRYGEGAPTLPEVRRAAGTMRGHPTAGVCAVGARPVLIAYNVWLVRPDLERARAIASEVRSPFVRALGLAVGAHVQVSMNLVDPLRFGPEQAYAAVASRAEVARAELVGLVPAAVLAPIPAERWRTLDLDSSQTIEARAYRHR
jgi:glutamate formiminotransferase